MANFNDYPSTSIDWNKLSNNILTTRTPFRIGFVGRGTDISDYWRNYGGEVVSAAIDKFISAKKIVFCEGHRLTNNPFFNYLPLLRTKGELITVKLKALKVMYLMKKIGVEIMLKHTKGHGLKKISLKTEILPMQWLKPTLKR